jgi:hypothetical protein
MTAAFPVAWRYTHDELLRLFQAASHGDVDKGGRYDARGAAINIWSHSWHNDATHHDSTIIGSFYVTWADENRIYEVECDAGFDLADLRHELALLEVAALGYVKHGVRLA